MWRLSNPLLRKHSPQQQRQQQQQQQQQQQPPSSQLRGAFQKCPTSNKKQMKQQQQQQQQSMRQQKFLLSGLFIIILAFYVIHHVRTDRENGLLSGKAAAAVDTKHSNLSNNKDNDSKSTRSKSLLCNKYRGILHIQQGDREGAAGSIFFLFILNQLFYADMYQLLPWIHLNDVSQYVYDDKVHGIGGGGNDGDNYDITRSNVIPVRHVPVWRGAQVSWSEYVDPQLNKSFPYPGPPIYLSPDSGHLQLHNMSIVGNGVWESYFQQPSYPEFTMPLLDCPHLPLLSMTFDQIIPSLHAFCPWSVRAWPYGGLPPSLQPYSKNQTTLQWLEPQRIRAHALVIKYYHFQPDLVRRINDEWSNATAKSSSSSSTSPTTSSSSKSTTTVVAAACLGMHVRHSDKANMRKRIPTDRFKPYVNAYRNAGGTCVYLATDSHKVVSRIQTNWPSTLSRMIYTPSSVIRSSNKTAVFVLVSSNHDINGAVHHRHHRTNTEVLVDIAVLSKCQFLLHGYSAVSEASIYLNLRLHNQSVNLEKDRHDHHASVTEFESMVRRVLLEQQQQQQDKR